MPLSKILETRVPKDFFVSAKIRGQRLKKCEDDKPAKPGIWHENKSGHISVYPFSCALRAGASYNYLLVDGIRRLTGREMFRLQGFPESFIVPDTYGIARHQAGNSLPVPVAKAIIQNVISGFMPFVYQSVQPDEKSAAMVFEEGVVYGT